MSDPQTMPCKFSWGGTHHLHKCSSTSGHALPHICGEKGSRVQGVQYRCDDTWWNDPPGDSTSGQQTDRLEAIRKLRQRSARRPSSNTTLHKLDVEWLLRVVEAADEQQPILSEIEHLFRDGTLYADHDRAMELFECLSWLVDKYRKVRRD